MTPPSTGRKITFASVVVLALLGVAEVACRLFPAPTLATLSEVAFDLGGSSAVYEPDSELFWRLRPGLDLTFQGAGLRTNSLGLRGPEPVNPKVLCIGDSVTFGFAVEEPESWPQLLSQQLGVEVLNAGVPGYSTHQGLILLKRLLGRYRPAVVVLSFGFNDAHLFPFDERRAAQGMRARLRSWLMNSAMIRRLSAAFGEGEMVRQARELVETRNADHRSFPPRSPEDMARFLAGEDAIRKRLERSPPRVSAAAYAENLKVMIDLVRAQGAVPVLLAPAAASDGLEPYFAASRLVAPVSSYREVMRQLALRMGVAHASEPKLCEPPEAMVPWLFLTHELSAEEAGALRQMAPDAASRAAMGITPDFRYRADTIHPSPRGYALLAGTVAAAVRPQLAPKNADPARVP